MDYNQSMFEIRRTAKFDAWLTSLKDRIGQKHVIARLTRLSGGHWGDCKPVGGEVVELRIHAGPRYRIYC